MPRNNKARTSGLCSIVVHTAKRPQGFVAGFVDQFSITESIRGELIYEIGRQRAAENVLHGIDRVDISWGRTMTIPEEDLIANGIVPGDADLAGFSTIDITFVDNDRGEVICEVRQVIPSSMGFSTSALAKISENCSMTGVHALWASELN